jgi:ATP-dependent exoDNAse (exonuclease V) alpha subunit
MEFSEDQIKFLEAYERGENIYLCGEAGTGKSTMLWEVMKRNPKAVILAPTGVAAVNVGGTTIHRFFKFPIGILTRGHVHNSIKDDIAELVASTKTLIIDEISMVRSDLFRAINLAFQIANNNERPFGGIQVIVTGDFNQLPPVVTEKEKDFIKERFCFSTEAWENANFSIVLLRKNFRAEKDEDYRNYLMGVKVRHIPVLHYLNKKCHRPVPDDIKDITHLCTTNRTAERINREKLEGIPGEKKTFSLEKEGRISSADIVAESNLELKVGSKVMCIKNLHEKRVYNGQTGYVKNIKNNEIIVEFSSQTFSIYRETWEVFGYTKVNGEAVKTILGSYKQFPLKLAYAITIHKSQGKTIKPVKLELGGGCFEHGQLYVALSRSTELNDIYLEDKLHPDDLIVSREVKDFVKENKLYEAT